MEQQYHHHEKWEDHKNGMYATTSSDEVFFIDKSLNLLSNSAYFYDIMLEMLDNWVFCIEHNLTNRNINRKAYLGAAACNFKYKSPEYCTRKAWWLLTDKQRTGANFEAKRIIDKFESKYKKQLWIEFT